ncbi:unnamed protein product [Effrenium voratum]|uniref:Uncharacterized protein n=1 Tax=Effrenium voratum TaxID=2562239 RepID=A0AA36IGU5_9DINO|nr:unnamed protein product [Effrenium voratum]CAJ1387530.1 unnamed protein product [Effrenium voratum]
MPGRSSGPYGSIPLDQAKPNRPRLLILPLGYCILVPWAIFSAALWVRSFHIHYLHPTAALVLEVMAWLFAVCLAFFALGRQARRLKGEAVDASWINFMALSLLLALVTAGILGEYNFKVNMEPYYDVVTLQTYTDIDPVNARGEKLLDAGRIVFTKASHLDINRSMGYMDTETWCVAPVTTRSLDANSTEPAVLDFWAIGKNCCSGSTGGDFRCGSWSSHLAHGGLRLLNDDERPLYRLAVHQAEAAYNIQVQHPIFLYWMPEPIEEVDAYSHSGRRFFRVAVLSYLCFQLSLVFMSVLCISKLARL